MDRKFIFKIKFGDTLRRISVEPVGLGQFDEYPYLTFAQLESTIRQSFRISPTSKVSILYIDRDNDEVIMVDDKDIVDACVYQKLNPVRVTVRLQEEELPTSVCECKEESIQALSVNPPPWAADILMKLDQLLLAVDKPRVEPGVASVSPASTKADDHVREVDDSPADGSTPEPAKDVVSSEEWRFDSAQSGPDSEFLKRVAILRQRGLADNASS